MVQFLIGLVIIVGIIFAIIFLYFLNIWIKAVAAGAHISIFNLLGMKLRGIPPALIVNAKIMVVKAGLKIETSELEAHHLARGNVMRVVQSLIAADKANIPLNFKRGAAIDLAGRDILEAVHMSVIPKVIDAPDPSKGKSTVDAVAMDGVQLLAKARVTVRTNLERLVGGAGEDTVIARVGEGIVTTIGSAETHKRVLENPDLISQKVLEKGLDAGTAYEILSIDIADVDVGKNIGAELQQRRAEADLQIAKAKAEERRAMAVAREQEMRALVEEMRAKVVEAEVEVPKAIAYAFKEGRLGLMDYYNLKNIQADTKMRESLAGRPEKKEKK
ncbi:flotillin-like protein FloA [bacterium]|nr:flotillin-like protein FloA [bacterium]NIN92568.1 flotillin-like protein FloA [bacterium]NIO18610.1 flotillin-like protein FloA [bacterium]NIO73625.1 flotillin-like protein FloA [bacterium]